MCISLFLRFYNFIEEIVQIYMVYLKKLRPLVLYLTYQLVQIFITLNRTNVSLFKKLKVGMEKELS